jgi:5-methylcytosine-specific restriction endonuclease McrA
MCAHCGGNEDLAFDHIVPFSKGGSSTDPSNIQVLCRACSSRKRAKFIG